jgi:uncharacterized OsmC-like protein
MNESEKIKQAFERSAKALSLKPSLGNGTGVSKTKVKKGLTCEIQEGNWKFLADMPASVGGNAEAPTPGVYGRAALGSCLAIGYMMRAAKWGITVEALEVEVQADYDDGALFGVSDKDPGYLEVRYIVTIETDAPEEDILKWLDEADEHSPYLDVFSRGQTCKREVHINSPKTQS